MTLMVCFAEDKPLPVEVQLKVRSAQVKLKDALNASIVAGVEADKKNKEFSLENDKFSILVKDIAKKNGCDSLTEKDGDIVCVVKEVKK